MKRLMLPVPGTEVYAYVGPDRTHHDLRRYCALYTECPITVPILSELPSKIKKGVVMFEIGFQARLLEFRSPTTIVFTAQPFIVTQEEFLAQFEKRGYLEAPI